jgi:hypothetical protein
LAHVLRSADEALARASVGGGVCFNAQARREAIVACAAATASRCWRTANGRTLRHHAGLR